MSLVEYLRRLQINPEDTCADIFQHRQVTDCVGELILPVWPNPSVLIVNNPWLEHEMTIDLNQAFRMKFNWPINDSEG